jgi:hypothetical protein
MLRAFALACLPIWLGAIFLCSSHCADAGVPDSHGGHHDAVASHHNQSPAPDTDHHEDDHSSFCDSLNTITLSSGELAIVKPHFALAFVSIVLLPSPALAVDCEKTLALCQPKPADFVFTPEVCLGPAFRSLAPPCLPIA